MGSKAGGNYNEEVISGETVSKPHGGLRRVRRPHNAGVSTRGNRRAMRMNVGINVGVSLNVARKTTRRPRHEQFDGARLQWRGEQRGCFARVQVSSGPCVHAWWGGV